LLTDGDLLEKRSCFCA